MIFDCHEQIRRLLIDSLNGDPPDPQPDHIRNADRFLRSFFAKGAVLAATANRCRQNRFSTDGKTKFR